MRWIRYKAGGAVRYGVMNGDEIEEIDGGPFETSSRTGIRLILRDVQVLPPVIPFNFYAVGFNYLAHTSEASGFLQQQQQAPSKPDVGYGRRAH